MGVNRFALVLVLLLLQGKEVLCNTVPPFPLNETVQRARSALDGAAIQPTGLNSTFYLDTIEKIVDFFKQHQDADGRIIDPYEKKEIQYSTPTFALATAILVAENYKGSAGELVGPASRALTSSLTQIETASCAQGTCHFYVMPSMLAYSVLKKSPLVSAETIKAWEQLASKIDPEKSYDKKGNNWDSVALTGEYLRYKLGLSNSTEWLESTLTQQMTHFTSNGQYQDHTGYKGLNPMPYDHFPRKYLTVMLEWGYNLSHAENLSVLLPRGAFVSLLMQSPWGELPTGGRSSQHQWNEAVQTVTYEIYARNMAKLGDLVMAKAFKRAAHLALKSVRRWINPAGGLFIVKNRFDPKLRFGYQAYSYYSNYNLLTASMLATAFLYCDDSIEEGPTFADAGGFVFEIPDFHKIFANAGGMYVEIETGADPHYDSTGLTRVHTPGVEPLIMPTAGTAENSGPLSVSPVWYDDLRKQWGSVAQVGYEEHVNYSLSVTEMSTTSVQFGITWDLGSNSSYAYLDEEFNVTPKRVEGTVFVTGRYQNLGYMFPAFLFDGKTNSSLNISSSADPSGNANITVNWPTKSTQMFQITNTPSSNNVALPCDCERITDLESRNGYLAQIRCTVKFYNETNRLRDAASISYALVPQT
ncbi:uncharacterized protein [Oscarella lobularis]|uniref:uncharacterized protein n=1 Tax=Oscarella lobularis TaxID=121494 RepID=UPI00331449AD